MWLEGKPAQALLQVNRAFLADLTEEPHVFLEFAAPYQAITWLLQYANAESDFLGNPVRHYQHLATRMSGPRSEVRRWRAWACFHLAESILPADKFPRDIHQIENERLLIPSLNESLTQIAANGWPHEAKAVTKALNKPAAS